MRGDDIPEQEKDIKKTSAVQQAKRRRLPATVLTTIYELVDEGITSAPAISAELTRRGVKDVPDPRTIRNIVAERTPPDDDGPWRLAESSADDARAILPVLAAVVEQTRGARKSFTRAEARWISTIVRAAPELAGKFLAFRLGREAVLTAKTHPETLEVQIAMAPWRSREALEAYQRAINEGWVEPGLVYVTVAAQVAVTQAAASVAATAQVINPDRKKQREAKRGKAR